MQVEVQTAKAHSYVITMADHECGNELLQRIALAVFDDHPEDRETVVVEVHEHAGWYLTYGVIDGRITCVGSANDSARFDPKVKEFWGRINAMECVYHPWVRRPSPPCKS